MVDDVDGNLITTTSLARPERPLRPPQRGEPGNRRPAGRRPFLPEAAGTTVRTRALGVVRMSLVTVAPETVSRSWSTAHAPAGEIILMLVRRGAVVVMQDGIRATAREGALVMLDSARPYRMSTTGPVELAVVRAEHRHLGLIPNTTSYLTASPWTEVGGLRALSADTFASLADNLDEIEEAAGEAMGLTVTSLMAGLFADRLMAGRSNPPVARQILLLRILSYTRDMLGEPTLIPARVAQRFSISLRYLQVLFAELGTSPARWIRDERLARLHADLRNPRFDHLPVAALGESWGMVGASQVSRLFRARYGLTPSEFRRQRPT
jgi:AraC-like DNA-binding protein